MPASRWHLLGTAALIVAAGSCDRKSPVTAPAGAAAAAADVVPNPNAEFACATISVALHGNQLDSVSVVPAGGGVCGTALEITLAGVPEFDGGANVLRLPVALHNAGQKGIRAPANLFGWEDSLAVTSPPGLANNKHTATYLSFVNPDSATDAGAAAFAGAVVWKLDSLLADGGGNPVLAAGATSRPAWVEVAVKSGVHGIVLSLKSVAAVAAVPAAPIVIAMDTGVVGPSWTIDTTAMVGDRVSYAFTPADGFTNVQVRIDGARAAASGTIVADTAGHAITATADRVIEVPSAAEGVYAAAQAVLAATDVPAAYQAFLDAEYAYVEQSPDRVRALQDVDDVEEVAFDYLTHQVDLRRVDSVLAGYSFRLGPDSLGDPGGTPIVNPSDTGVFITNRAPAAARAAAPGAPAYDVIPGDTIEPTTLIYMNGIWTNQEGAAAAWSVLFPIIRSIQGFQSGKISGRYHYNRTFQNQPLTHDEQLADCTSSFAAPHLRYRYGTNSLPDYLARCMQDSTLRDMSALDIVEAIRQMINIHYNVNAPELDAIALANDVERDRDAGRQVILVAHSQGNVMAMQAIDFLAQHNKYHGLLDPSCIGVVSLASPMDPSNFTVPVHQRAAVVVDGDLVPSIGGNASPRTSTALSRAVDQQATLLANTNSLSGLLYRTYEGFFVLHSIGGSYLRYEAADAVKASITQVYGACTVHDLEPAQQEMTVTRGNRFAVGLRYLNTFGDALWRSAGATRWDIADSSIVGPATGGTFRALADGSTTVTGTFTGHTAGTLVHVADPIPPAIVGQWSGTWYSETDLNAGGTMQVTISGTLYNMSATVTWTDQNGLVWNGYSSSDPTNIITDDPGISTARFWAAYKKPTDPNGFYFYRDFILSNLEGSNQATGSAADGSGIDTWIINLTRVNP